MYATQVERLSCDSCGVDLGENRDSEMLAAAFADSSRPKQPSEVRGWGLTIRYCARCAAVLSHALPCSHKNKNIVTVVGPKRMLFWNCKDCDAQGSYVETEPAK